MAEQSNATVAADLIDEASRLLEAYDLRKQSAQTNGAWLHDWASDLVEFEETFKAASLLLQHETRRTAQIDSIRDSLENLQSLLHQHKVWMLERWSKDEIRAHYPDPFMHF